MAMAAEAVKAVGITAESDQKQRSQSPSESDTSTMTQSSIEDDIYIKDAFKPFHERTTVFGDVDDWVVKNMLREKPLPPITWDNWIQNINWDLAPGLFVLHLLGLISVIYIPIQRQTVIWSTVYYIYSALGITAGYHRLWAHRAYTAGKALQWFLSFGGASALQGDIIYWSRGHRSHHRYTDTDLDPYAGTKGFFWTHIGWVILKHRRRPGLVDVSDLRRNRVVDLSVQYYFIIAPFMGFAVPCLVAWIGWGDPLGGLAFCGLIRALTLFHGTMCVNSFAHWLGEQPFDSKHTPRNHLITAILTLGEGYHNFHHQFPQDFRNAYKAHQYDPTKWFIWVCGKLGFAHHLKTTPDNEVEKSMYLQTLRELQRMKGNIEWPRESDDLPIISWKDYQKRVNENNEKLLLIAGFIHDVTDFQNEHPGGAAIIKSRIGKDATTAFHGGVYEHSNSAHNRLAMLRVAYLRHGYDVISERMEDFEQPSSTEDKKDA